MNFASDNVTRAAPEIMAALQAVNHGAAMPYGQDGWTSQLRQRLSGIFERPCEIFPVLTGTAANSLCLAAMAPSFGAIYCHEEAHIQSDECGAPEHFTGGAKLVPLAGADGKLQPATLSSALYKAGKGVVHRVQPTVLSLSQATEVGTLYRPEEIRALTAVARAHGLKMHMDGARFANAVASLDCHPKDITWDAGIDLLALGATKNGALAAEVIVCFDPDLAERLAFLRKRSGQLLSKMRFVSAQLLAYFEGGLWLRLAVQANLMATKMADGLAILPGLRILYPVEANEIFVSMPRAAADRLMAAGFIFYHWTEAPDARETIIRLVTAFDTVEADVEAFLREAEKSLVASSKAVL